MLLHSVAKCGVVHITSFPMPRCGCGQHASYMPILKRTQLGLNAQQVAHAVASGEILRVRKGWYATPGTPELEILACRLGGSLTAFSAIKAHGLWVWTDRVHVRVPRNAARLKAPGQSICRHWGNGPLCGTDDLERAIHEASHCGTQLELVTALDSALDTYQLDWGDLAAMARVGSSKLRTAIQAASVGMQSGYETKMKLFLRSQQIRFVAQALIAGVGRVDFLVGNRLVIEMDGFAYHSQAEFTKDRQRDIELVRRGYRVIRISSAMARDDWDAVCAKLMEVVRRREHVGQLRVGSVIR